MNAKTDVRGLGRSKYLGRHLLVELYGCEPELLKDLEYIRELLQRAVEASGSKNIGECFRSFPGTGGVTGIVIIAESHFSIHTWPEHGYAAVDVFTCGETVDPWKGYEVLVKGLKASRVRAMELKRGSLEVS